MHNRDYILIIDDELFICEHIKLLLHNIYPDFDIKTACRLRDAREIIEDSLPFLALVDIRIGHDESGIEFSTYLSDENIPFLFVTAHGDRDTVSAAMISKPLGYLIKPVSQNELFVGIELALSKIGRDQFFVFKEGTKTIKLREQDIVYLKSDKNYSEIHTENERFVVRLSCKNITSQLDIKLVQTHKAFYINPAYIKEVKDSVLLSTNSSIPLSRHYKDSFFENWLR